MHEERADRILDGLTERLPDLMNNAELGDKLAQATEAFKQGVAERMTVRGVGAASDLSVRDVLARMRAGESIGEVAQSLGLSAAEVADAATPMLLQHLERPLQTGIISQEEADDFVAEFPERVAQVLEAPAQD
jgi:chromosome condensin MukBEF complex kleisin-like MukF subunit